LCIKDTVEDELADVIIRTLDLCGYLGIDIEKHVELKMRYNESREYKHGKNY
jgi:NTP pyrophosphatase (non-canonical NTP hydrolase)